MISLYTPQFGRTWEEKETFVEGLEEMIRKLPWNETLISGGDFNAHLGESNKDYTEEHDQQGYGSGNDEGDLRLEMMQANLLCAINTCFKKRKEHLITYKRGNNSTQVDYIIVRQDDRKIVKNVKVLPFEVVVKQHRLLRVEDILGQQ